VSRAKARVEIYSDAGVKCGVGAWGAVIVRLDGRGGIVEASGILRAEVGSDTERAEAQAAANAVAKAKREGLIETGERVVVYCDNQMVVCYWRGTATSKKGRPGIRRALQVIRAIAVELQCVIEFRCVKGHAPLVPGDRQSYLNARADALCCAALGTKRKGRVEVRDGIPTSAGVV
jgi:ribonuclease HI